MVIAILPTPASRLRLPLRVTSSLRLLSLTRTLPAQARTLSYIYLAVQLVVAAAQAHTPRVFQAGHLMALARLAHLKAVLTLSTIRQAAADPAAVKLPQLPRPLPHQSRLHRPPHRPALPQPPLPRPLPHQLKLHRPLLHLLPLHRQLLPLYKSLAIQDNRVLNKEL